MQIQENKKEEEERVLSFLSFFPSVFLLFSF